MGAKDIPLTSEEARNCLEQDLAAVSSETVPGFRRDVVGAKLAQKLAAGLNGDEARRLEAAMSETEPPPPSRWRGRTILLFSAAGLMVAASAVAIGGRYLAPPPPAVNGNGQATDAHVPGNVRAASAAPVAPSPPVEAPLGPQPLQPESKQKSVRREPAGTPGEAPPSEKNDLIAREIQQMREIRALLGQDPRKALALAEAGHVAFARGMLYEEREAHAILALARLGQVAAARPRAARFLKSSPHGPFSQRVREAVGLR